MTNAQKEYRQEKDFLGEKQIEADVYYGIQTLRAKENFPITGYRIHEEMINALAIVKKAAALANMDVKRLYEGIGNAIVQAADEINFICGLDNRISDSFIQPFYIHIGKRRRFFDDGERINHFFVDAVSGNRKVFFRAQRLYSVIHISFNLFFSEEIFFLTIFFLRVCHAKTLLSLCGSHVFTVQRRLRSVSP